MDGNAVDDADCRAGCVFALWETFVLPWESIPLGIVVGVLAVAGRLRRLAALANAVLLMALAFGPYAIFHLLFQETSSRAVCDAHAAGDGVARRVARRPPHGRGDPGGERARCRGGAVVRRSRLASPTDGSRIRPSARLRAMQDAQRGRLAPAAVHAHYSLRRPLQAAAGPCDWQSSSRVAATSGSAVVNYWRGGGRAPIWFLADPTRTDLALIDPQSRRDVTRFRWKVDDRSVLSGTRPLAADWYRLNPPGWFARRRVGSDPGDRRDRAGRQDRRRSTADRRPWCGGGPGPCTFWSVVVISAPPTIRRSCSRSRLTATPDRDVDGRSGTRRRELPALCRSSRGHSPW